MVDKINKLLHEKNELEIEMQKLKKQNDVYISKNKILQQKTIDRFNNNNNNKNNSANNLNSKNKTNNNNNNNNNNNKNKSDMDLIIDLNKEVIKKKKNVKF